ncbi:MAG: cyclic pyranopterin monophosphate synthase MoaC [Chloroflexota bacterium]|nr:cyclic pyranopterin monophosphate synthase MoaC [Chloroflexota bacterium]MDE2946920.1 cyclic pyranopterin monophosphate synthase MoaC [Chloroflexota bacterium]
MTAKNKLTHLDETGRADMVDVGGKPFSERLARAAGAVLMQPATLALIREGNIKKGDVLNTARIAGVMAAKRTADLIPLCHPLPVNKIGLKLAYNEAESAIEIQATVKTTGRTGVEMEALTAVSVAALTIYDMAKAVDRGMRITEIRLLEKRGGASGDYQAEA